MAIVKHTILVLDDDPDIGIMIKIMLEYKGYEVQVTDKASRAIEIMQSDDVDLLVMDMLLSGVNGTDVCIAVKKDPVTSKIPVVMISAHPNAAEICFSAGADDFIAKPFDMQDLLSRVGKLVNNDP